MTMSELIRLTIYCISFVLTTYAVAPAIAYILHASSFSNREGQRPEGRVNDDRR